MITGKFDGNRPSSAGFLIFPNMGRPALASAIKCHADIEGSPPFSMSLSLESAKFAPCSGVNIEASLRASSITTLIGAKA